MDSEEERQERKLKALRAKAEIVQALAAYARATTRMPSNIRIVRGVTGVIEAEKKAYEVGLGILFEDEFECSLKPLEEEGGEQATTV